CRNSASTSSCRVTSVGTVSTSAPRPRSLTAAASSFSAPRAAITSLAPARANAAEMAFPSPPDPPVTRTTVPCQSLISRSDPLLLRLCGIRCCRCGTPLEIRDLPMNFQLSPEHHPLIFERIAQLAVEARPLDDLRTAWRRKTLVGIFGHFDLLADGVELAVYGPVLPA